MNNPSAKTSGHNREIEFWFEFGSNYSYLSVMRIEALAVKFNVTVIWKPFLLGPIFKSFGWDSSPFVLQKEKGKYMWQDMVRECKKYNLPWKKPGTFPRAAIRSMRVAVVGRNQAWMGDYCRAIMQLNFAADHEINSPEIVLNVLRQLDLPAKSILDDSQSEKNKPLLRALTEEAINKGIFGAPSFFVRDQMFWGNDRLEDALAYAVAEII